eukprot:GHVL01003743.1.p1 GENE.GHVL01003743.1~~GHVL01003743.1.p1  ORF type:complete len:1101 (+),score=237.29 GHVL01003743.1:70-3372(+)
MPLKEIDKNAVAAWSPYQEDADPSLSKLLVLASNSSNGESALDFCSFDVGSAESTLPIDFSLGLESRINCVCWSPQNNIPSGVIAGGFVNGVVKAWAASDLVRSKSNAREFKDSSHTGDVTAIEVSVNGAGCILHGDKNGELRWSVIGDPNGSKAAGASNIHLGKAAITVVKWHTQAACSHILASGDNTGSAMVWDQRADKAVFKFNDDTAFNKCRQHISGIAWKDTTGLFIADSVYQKLQQWDLRHPQRPLKELQAHQKGIASIDLCRTNPNLMLSSGRDSRTICWYLDASGGQTLCDVPTPQNTEQVKWAENVRAVFSTASQGKVSVHSLQQARTSSCRYTPPWVAKPCGSAFGFGGKFVVCGKNQGLKVRIYVIPDEPDVINAADQFDEFMKNKDFEKYCTEKTEASFDEHEKQTWAMLGTLFQPNHRNLLLSHLVGFSHNDMVQEAEAILGTPPGVLLSKNNQIQTPVSPSQLPLHLLAPVEPHQAASFFEEFASVEEETKPTVSAASDEKPTDRNDWNTGRELLIKEAVVLGDLPAAVELALKSGRLADALLIAGSGTPELWQRAREEYVKMQRDSFLNMVSSIGKEDFDKLVAESDLDAWNETLATLCTYSDNFSKHCELLGDRLKSEKLDFRAAVLCFLCSKNFQKTVVLWASMSSSGPLSMTQELQELVQKMAVLQAATGFCEKNEIFTQRVTQYAETLANSGRVSAAMQYLSLLPSEDSESAVLRDRIFQSTVSAPLNQSNAGPQMQTQQKSAPRPSMMGHPSAGPPMQTSMMGAPTLGPPPTGPPSVGPPPINKGIGPPPSGPASSMGVGPPPMGSSMGVGPPPMGSSMGGPPMGSSMGGGASNCFGPPPTSSYRQSVGPPPTTSQNAPHSGPLYSPPAGPQLSSGPPAGPPMSSGPPAGPPMSSGSNFPPSTDMRGTAQQSTGPSMNNQFGTKTTNPASGAMHAAPGMPVSWPVPTPTQQQGSATQSTRHINEQVHKMSVANSKPIGHPMNSQDLDTVQTAFSSLVTRANYGGDSKKLEDNKKRIEELYNKLSTGNISDVAANKVVDLARAVIQQNWQAATALQIELTKLDWENNKAWIIVVKRLLTGS